MRAVDLNTLELARDGDDPPGYEAAYARLKIGMWMRSAIPTT